MVDKVEKIWMDGELVAWEDANVHILTHTLHYGLGAFEGIRCYETDDGRSAIFRLEEHVRRLFDSAHIATMDVAFTQEQIVEACIETVRVNGLKSCYLRPLIFLGDGAMGLGAMNDARVAIVVWKWGAYLGDEGLEKGIKACISSFTRPGVNMLMAKGKIVGHYVNSILARYEANDNGFDEAVMLDQQGYVAEGTGENLFVMRDGVVKTPPVVNILAGITRRTAIEILEKHGREVLEMPFGRDALYVADEIFMTGTAAEITPVREVDRRAVGEPGPITREVQRTYLDGVRGKVDWMKDFITTY